MMVQHAGEMISNFSVGHDGKVTFQNQGAQMRRGLTEFSEMVHWMPASKLHRGNSEPRWHNGIWLGVRPQSTEILIGTPQDVSNAGSVNIMPESMWWSVEVVKALKGTSWKP